MTANDQVFAQVSGVHFGKPSSSNGGTCTWTPDAGAAFTKTVNSIIYVKMIATCTDSTTAYWVPAINAQQLGQTAVAHITELLPKPSLGSAPPTTSGFVKVAMWYWATPDTYKPISITAWIPTVNGPLIATTTATPTTLTYTPGEPDSQPTSCQGPGPQWLPAYGDDTPSPCMYTYIHASSITRSGFFQASLTTTWNITWRTSNGQTGTPTIHTTTTTTTTKIQEIQALITYND